MGASAQRCRAYRALGAPAPLPLHLLAGPIKETAGLRHAGAVDDPQQLLHRALPAEQLLGRHVLRAAGGRVPGSRVRVASKPAPTHHTLPLSATPVLSPPQHHPSAFHPPFERAWTGRYRPCQDAAPAPRWAASCVQTQSQRSGTAGLEPTCWRGTTSTHPSGCRRSSPRAQTGWPPLRGAPCMHKGGGDAGGRIGARMGGVTRGQRPRQAGRQAALTLWRRWPWRRPPAAVPCA